MQPKLLLGTNNAGKLREYRSLLEGLRCELVTPAEMGINETPDEIGRSLEENARLKAIFYATRSDLLALADDSGLEIDALGGAPGVLSARYAGEGASDKERINFLLARLKGIPLEKRSARFRCVIAIALRGNEIAICEGVCEGIIIFEPRGEEGFGYDPIFYLPDLGKTMAELPMELKNQVSHRARAAKKAFRVLGEMGCA